MRNRAGKSFSAIAAIALGLAALQAHAGADLTPTETRWLELGTPVLGYALKQKLPLDVMVQPTARPGEPPLTLGFVDGRCKLVMAMRGNPEAEATLDAIEPELLGAVVEAMTAHELGHCWRYVHGAWHSLPAGFVAEPREADEPHTTQLRREMRETRREEGYADLVGLAWTARQHPAQYARVHAWLAQLREREPAAGSHHDTRAWVRLARDPEAFTGAATPFGQAEALWRRGLEDDAP
jgi:ADP-ribose pyrophosphatase YjhB (NUDIX family)